MITASASVSPFFIKQVRRRGDPPVNIPESLKQYKQFINYGSDKKPFDPILNGYPDHLNPVNQLTFSEAFDRAALYGLGIGFVITANDPFFFLDIDHAYENGQWSDLSVSLCQYFTGCYYETSMSGVGCHIIGSLSDFPAHACKNTPHGLELYTEGRYVALTTTHATGEPLTLADRQVQWLIENYFPPSAVSLDGIHKEWTTGPVPDWHGPADDGTLIKKMLNSKSASAVFGGTASIADLWNRNVTVLGSMYPHEENEFDCSSADQALLSHLAFWTGKDCARMERLFGLSGLVREKWTDRQDYRTRSILNACAHCRNVYGQGAQLPESTSDQPTGDPVPRDPGFQFMTPETQLEYFTNCVYIGDQNKILIPNGRLLKKSQFDAQYGGWVFAIDSENDKTVKSAWDVFTMSQAIDFPKVDHIGFYPRLKTRELFSDEVGRNWVNSYTPVKVRSKNGNVDKFINHIKLLLPNATDRNIVLSYLASIVQYQGYKFHWCLVLQGTYGNGTSLLAKCIENAVGEIYCHSPDAQEMHEKYNDWMLDKVFIAVEEMRVGEKKFDLMHKLQTLIDSEKLEIRKMQSGKRMYHVCANFLLLANEKHEIIKHKDDRRYCPIFTAQQSKEDKLNHGLTPAYFSDIFAWLKGTGKYQGMVPGYANVTHFLKNYPIPLELNPAVDAGGLCVEAPDTSSTEEAIRFSYGRAEQEVLAAIEEEVQGFRGGWISSVQLSKLFESKRVNKALNRRAEMLKTLGYIPHPALNKGRAGGINMFDGRRPYLYVTPENPACNITDKTAITAAYMRAQGFGEITN